MTSVKEADVVDVAERVGPVDRLHDLILAMSGRVDDDAVNSAREMLGVGQLDAAAEFLAGCLLAGRIPVDSTEQHHLRRVLDEARSDQALAERLHVVESLPTDQHRFSDQDESDADLIAALDPIAGRLGGVRALWCAWRVTPAGVTYGAVPQRVLLAEIDPDGSTTAAGYQLVEALRRAGVGCSVEVFHSGADLPEYHRNALAAARRVNLDMSPVAANRNGANRARTPRSSSGGDSGGSNDLPSDPPISTAEPAPDPVVETQLQDAPAVEPVPEPPAPAAPADLDEEPEPAAEEPGAAPRHRVDHERLATDPPSIPDPATSQPDVREAEVTQEPETVSAEPDAPSEEESAEEDSERGSKNMRVPAAVDAKLTNRERNLLRKLHEELAQREQDRGGNGGEQQEAWTSVPGTGGFPPMGAGPAPSGDQAENKQP